MYVMESQPDAVTQLLALIHKQWQGIGKTRRPSGYWVCEYAALPSDAYDVNFQAMPERVWFCDLAGQRPESIEEWLRLTARKPVLDTSSGGRPFVGKAAFARYADSDDYYLGMNWAARYGIGWLLSPDPSGRMTAGRRLWIS